jgi:hypothetical protein
MKVTILIKHCIMTNRMHNLLLVYSEKYPERVGPYYTDILLQSVGRVAQSEYGLRAGRSVDRIPLEARFSAPVQTGPKAQPASYTMGTGSFLGVESGRGVTLTPHPF